MEQKTNQGNELKEFNYANEPNAAILIYALQHLGYKNDVALCDIIDNSIDAGATKISLYIDNNKIMIVDNGKGMTLSILDEALKLGSDIIREDNTTLGKFGMGLSTASISIADRTTVLTKSMRLEQILKSSVDINIVKLSNKFVKYIGEANQEDERIFHQLLDKEKSGTIVILEQCTGIKNKNLNQFSNRMKSVIGRIYRKFMSKIDFYVNDIKVEMDDTLLLDDKETQVYSDENYEIKWKDKNGKERKSTVNAKLVLLPVTPQEESKQKKINIPNQGFSILRNSREIAFGYMPWMAKHNRFNRFRGEISFQSDMDEAMGVDFTKNGIDMIDSVNDILQQYLKVQIIAIGNKAKKESVKIADNSINHENAERLISTKSNILIIPKIEEYPYEEESKKDTWQEDFDESKIDTENMKNENKNTNVNVKFISVSAGRTGNIFDAHLEGKTTVIEWNIDHPFYEKFVLSNTENTELVTAVDYLIYSIATSQLKVLGDDNNKAEIIDQLISVMSNNMRTLLS